MRLPLIALLFLCLSLSLSLGCQRNPQSESKDAGASAMDVPTPPPASDKTPKSMPKAALEAQSAPKTPNSISPSPVTKFRTVWEMRVDRIEAAREGWKVLSPGEQENRIQDALRSVMSRHECNTVMGCQAEEVLIAAGPAAAEALIKLYPTVARDSYNKFHLIDILGEVGDSSSLPFLRKLLTDSQWNARANAAMALGRIGDASALTDLQETLKKAASSPDQAVEYASAFALERLQPGLGRETLLSALEAAKVASVNWGYTRYAVQAVGLLGMTQACPKLTPSLLHKDLFLRRQALQTVAALRCSQVEVLDAAAQSLEHAAMSVRDEASEALRAVTRVPIRNLKTWNKYKTNVLKVKE